MPEVRLIDANALMEKVCGNCQQNDCVPDATDTVYGCMVLEIINQMPTIEAKPVQHGHWEIIPGMNNTVFCSECLAAANKELAMKYKGCPFCLARIDGGAENDDIL